MEPRGLVKSGSVTPLTDEPHRCDNFYHNSSALSMYLLELRFLLLEEEHLPYFVDHAQQLGILLRNTQFVSFSGQPKFPYFANRKQSLYEVRLYLE